MLRPGGGKCSPIVRTRECKVVVCAEALQDLCQHVVLTGYRGTRWHPLSADQAGNFAPTVRRLGSASFGPLARSAMVLRIRSGPS